MNDELISVEVMVEGRARWGATVQMTRAEYVAWCDRVDNARGYEQERVAEKLLDLGRVDVMRDIDVDDLHVEDFYELKPRKPEEAA